VGLSVRILLPPSEAKQPGGRGRPLAARPPHPLLGPARAEVFGALETLLAAGPEKAAEALQLPPSVRAAALAANAAALTSPTRPALQRYRGVVYEGLAHDALPAAAQRLAGRQVHVLSGLFGVVRGDDPVPDYRVPAAAALPGLGILATHWRRVLTPLMAQLLGDDLVIDLRSTDYAAMWRPGRDHRLITVRAVSRLPSGGVGVISYNSKFAKGRLAAALVQRVAAGGAVASAADVVDAWRAATGRSAEALAAGQVEIRTDA
jgi:cytoplasmic iron level regulating protein YaaA (DUF328/UPF0246 family)